MHYTKDNLKNLLEERMKKSMDSFKEVLAKIRTSRASTSLLENILVDSYGNTTPLSHVASFTVLDAKTISIKPWDKNLNQAIDKAIRSSDLGLNPVVLGDLIKIVFPDLTQERRLSIVKLAKSESENQKVVIRNLRRDAMNDLKNMLKEKLISQDDEQQLGVVVQKLTDNFIAMVEKMLADKEKEIMTI